MRGLRDLRCSQRAAWWLRVSAFTLLVSGCGDACEGKTESFEGPSLFVLGVDGMDPVILQRMVDEEKLPAFKELIAGGGLQNLGTTNPPQSPVAWASFVTGLHPSGHGIYDFIHRDPQTYKPKTSAVQEDAAVWFGTGGPINARRGTPFWDLLEKAGVPTRVYRIPGNYPVPESDARTLSGMGTVDVQGTSGVFTWLTERAPANLSDLEGKADVQLLTPSDLDGDGRGDRSRASLKGPPDPLDPHEHLELELLLHTDLHNQTLLLEVDGQSALLGVGEWSDWIAIQFSGGPLGLISVEGRMRAYLKSLSPLRVYISPVNLAADNPAQTIATPDDWSGELHEALGDFYTQGMPEETNALKEGLFDDYDYAKQVKLVQQDTERMLDEALSAMDDEGGFTFFYVSDIDLQCHMLWRHGDPKNVGAPPHPAHRPELQADFGGAIEDYYRDVDGLLAKSMAALPEGARLVVISDHGFQSQHRVFELNDWLADEGYLVADESGGIDFTKTRAYGVGFNGLYLNLKGREGQGVVSADEAPALVAELQRKLLALRDGAWAAPPILSASIAHTKDPQAQFKVRPDILVGYNAGYGVSDDSALGLLVPRGEPFRDNLSPWSGNHLMDPSVVPGVLMSSGNTAEGAHLVDVTASILNHYGVSPDKATKPVF